MKSLLLIAHGSRKVSSNQEVADLAARISQNAAPFAAVRHCFLELTEPKAAQAIAELAELGSTEVVVMPYFLAAGLHVMEDLPKVLSEAQQAHPHIEFSLRKHLGAAESMARWVVEEASA